MLVLVQLVPNAEGVGQGRKARVDDAFLACCSVMATAMP